MTDEVVVVEPVAGLSQVERVVDTFVAPSKTFTDILRSANWVVPFLLLVIVCIATAFAVDKQVGFDRVVQNTINASPKAQERMADLTPEQKESTLKIQVVSEKWGTYFSPIFLLIFIFIHALLLWASFNFGLGAQTKYNQVVATIMYAGLPKLLQGILTIVTLYLGNNQESYDKLNPVGTNLGYYLTESPKWLRALLSGFDLIGLWALVVLVIGMSIVAKKSITQSAIVVVGWWIVGMLMLTGLSALG